VILGFTDPEYVADLENPMLVTAAILTAGQELATMVQQLAEARTREPRNDLITALVTSEVDGEHLTPEELASFFILLVVAGNETTRNAIAHGLLLLSQHPDQRDRWLADIPGVAPTAVEEIVRIASPVIHFRRTVTRDGVRLGDHEFGEGDRVVLWYWSANRDESVFADPYAFDVGRTPNDHVGFGGPGPHFCLGAHLARREIGVMLQELLARLPDIHVVGEPQRLRSNFINGIKHLDAEWSPSGG
jgi:cytochrome P450